MTQLGRVAARLLRDARYIPQTIALLWAATAGWTIVWLSLLIIQGLLPGVVVYLTGKVVDGLVAAVQSRAAFLDNTALLTGAAALGAVMLFRLLVSAGSRWVRFTQSELLQDYISRAIHRKSVSVHMSFYDFAEYHDQLYRARDEAGYRPMALLDGAGGSLQNTVAVFAVSAVILPFGVWLPVILILAGMPTLLLLLRGSLARHEWERRATEQVRRTWYLEHLMTSRETAPEIRLFNLGERFSAMYQTLRGTLRRERSLLVRREILGELTAAILGTCVAGSAAVWVVSEAIQGRVTTGALAMFFAAFVQAQAVMRSLLQNAGDLYANSLFLGHLFAFLALEQEPASSGSTPLSQKPLRRGIRFESIDFRYPHQAVRVLSGFTLDIPAGQTVAIIGANGAGKSTLIKLLCRFYEPEAGTIWIDGVDIQRMAPADVRQMMSVLFQEPIRYADTALANISPETGASNDGCAITSALRAAGAEGIVAKLPHQSATLLGKWFTDGCELSAGEWQRLALARAFYRVAPILLLDEPTSAMDPWAEAAWFERFRQVTGRTTIIITHRVSTAMRADVIYVVDNGRVAESGSHDQLVAAGGRYAGLCAAPNHHYSLGPV